MRREGEQSEDTWHTQLYYRPISVLVLVLVLILVALETFFIKTLEKHNQLDK